MQITENIHAIKIPFKLLASQGKTLDRFVYAYLIYGKRICLIDCGVASSEIIIFDYLKKMGRDPKEISMLVLTHSHPDHIGGGQAVIRESGCRVAAHIDAKPWIEDVECQFKKRPILNFHSLVEGSVEVDLVLRDGDNLDLGDGQTIKVVHTPGHSRGSVSLLLKDDGALFSGDAIPIEGGVPIYEDVLSSIRSIRKLRGIKGLEVLLASWDEPQHGDRVYELMDEGLRYFQQVHEVVRQAKIDSPSLSVKEVCARVFRNLGLPKNAMIPIVAKSIESHLKISGYQDLLQV